MSAAPGERDAEPATAESDRPASEHGEASDAASDGAGRESGQERGAEDTESAKQRDAGEREQAVATGTEDQVGGEAEESAPTREGHDAGEGENGAGSEQRAASKDQGDDSDGEQAAEGKGEDSSHSQAATGEQAAAEKDQDDDSDGEQAAEGEGAEEGDEDEEDKAAVKFSRLGLADVVGLIGSALLVLSLWVPWFSTNLSNPNSTIDRHRGHVIPWDAFHILPWILILLAIAPPVLSYVVLRGKELSYNRGEVTTLAGIIAFVFVISNGIVFGKPGGTPVQIGLWWGYLLALVAALAIAAGGILRQAENPPDPEPPGI